MHQPHDLICFLTSNSSPSILCTGLINPWMRKLILFAWRFLQEGTTMNYMGSRTNHMHNLTELVWQALETQVNLSLSLSLSLSLTHTHTHTHTFMFFLENVYDPYITNNGCTHDVGVSQWQSKPCIISLTNIHISVLLMLGWKRQEEQGPCNFQMILTTSQT